MTKYLIIIAILIILYLYWKAQQTKSNSPKPDEIIERQGKQKERSPDDFNQSSKTFWDAKDWEINSDNENKDNPIFGPSSVELPSAKFIPINDQDSDEEKPILSHKQQRQLRKKK